MLLIVGLGNPGRDYEDTRHNVGFMLIDRLSSAWGIGLRKSGKAFWGQGEILGQDVILLKPLTYMNLSGTVVSEFKKAHSADESSIIAAYDDCDLPLGRIRLRKGGGSGGHKGVASIIGCTGTPDFPRVRLGIGRPVHGELKDYVLSPFSEEEEERLEIMLKKGVDAIESFISHGIDYAMNNFNAAAD